MLQAHLHAEAAQLLMQLAKTESSDEGSLLRVKKLCLLAALEMDAFKARMLQMGGQSQSPANPGSPPPHGSKAAHTLAGMLC